jgi:hypothetical protein
VYSCIYGENTVTKKWLSFCSASPVTCPSSYPPSGTILAVAAPFVSITISGKPCHEVGELPGGKEEVVITMDISGEPGPEAGEPPPTWPPLITPSSTRSGSTFSPSAHGGDFLHRALFVSLRSVPNRIAQGQLGRPCFLFSFEKTKNRRKKGDGARKSVRLPRSVLHQHILLKYFPLWLCFLASAGCWRALLRAPGVARFVSRIASPFGGRENMPSAPTFKLFPSIA